MELEELIGDGNVERTTQKPRSRSRRGARNDKWSYQSWPCKFMLAFCVMSFISLLFVFSFDSNSSFFMHSQFKASLVKLSLPFSNSLNQYERTETFNRNKSSDYHSSYFCEPIKSNVTNQKHKFDGKLYPNFPLENFKNASLNFTCLNQNMSESETQPRKILLWNSFFSSKTWYWNSLGVRTPFIEQGCPVTNCELMNDRSRLSEADFVLVHMRNAVPWIPSILENKGRSRDQRWIMAIYESPAHTPNLAKYRGVFNGTATYRRDSMFSGFYEDTSTMRWRQKPLEAPIYTPKMFRKRMLAAGIVSNCQQTRMTYIRAMQAHAKNIDVFGKCGKRCPKSAIVDGNKNVTDCRNIVAHQYKFFLAYENSHCKDYITEKFFKTLRYPIVPVVFGSGVYDYYIPKSGYIDTRDYASPKALVDYLTYLNKNETAYMAYFDWKRYVDFESEQTHGSNICDICIQANLDAKLKLYQNRPIPHSVLEKPDAFWSKLHCH